MRGELVKLSKQLSKVLRHRPERWGLRLSRGGWVDVDTLIHAARRAGVTLDRTRVRELVQHQPKPRFELDPSGESVRARYGHSVDIELELAPAPPPAILYHGTAASSVASILREGLHAGRRRMVHLSDSVSDARGVGARHGRVRVLTVRSGPLWVSGHAFYHAAPGVWLTARVPPQVIEVGSASA